MKKVCAIYDADEQYAYRFINYVNDKKLMPYDVIMFTKNELLEEYLKDGRLEILLLSENTGISDLRNTNVGKIIKLSEDENTVVNGSVYKYQSADTVVKEIFRQLVGETQTHSHQDILTVNTDVIGVYSPIGRCHKTVLSLALAMAASRKGKTLYINLEEFCGISEFVSLNQGNLSDLIYHFRHNKNKLAKIFSETIISCNGFDYVPVCSSPEDFEEVMPEEWIEFIKYIISGSVYDTLVLDIGNVVHEPWKLMRVCRVVFMPCVSDIMGTNKVNMFEEYMKIMGQTDIINKIIKADIPYDSELEDGNLLEHLEWSSVGEYARRVLNG